VSCAKTAEPIEMPFWTKTQVDPKNHVLDGGGDRPRGRGNFRKLSRPFKSIGNLRCRVAEAFVAHTIIQSPITSCSIRDHSVCQASTCSILKISGCRRCVLSVAKGRWDYTAWAKSDIYDCFFYFSIIDNIIKYTSGYVATSTTTNREDIWPVVERQF